MVSMPVAVQSYRHRSLPGLSERLINSFIEPQPQEAKARLFLMPSPGLLRFSMLATGPVRGLHPFNEYCYAVGGTGVYRVNVSGSVEVCGNIADGGPVTMADNGTQVVVTAPETGQAWVITGTTLTQITDPDFPGASSVTVLDGFHIFSQPNTTRFFISSLLDATAYDALDFASAEASPDNIVRVQRIGRILWVFGERTVEFWSNTGATDFPFQRLSGESIERGCAARDSVAVAEVGGQATPFWLGDNRVIYRGDGGRAQRISNYAIEQAIAGYVRVDDARGAIIDQEGHTFYVLTFPSARPSGGATWVFDVSIGNIPHERESEGYGGVWRVGSTALFAGATIGGDVRDGRIYLIDPTVPTEDGETIIRTWIGVPQHKEMRRLFMTRLALDCETGVGALTGQGRQPQVWVKVSQDGGRTYGPALLGALGARGGYRTTIEWRRLGAARDVVFMFGMSDPVLTTVYAMHLDAEVGED